MARFRPVITAQFTVLAACCPGTKVIDRIHENVVIRTPRGLEYAITSTGEWELLHDPATAA